MRYEVANLRVFRVAALLSLFGVAGCAYQNPELASPAAPDPSAPSQLSLGVSGSATQGGTSAVTARVQNIFGAPVVNVLVTFGTTRGTISPAQAATGTNGTATAVLTAADTADVTAIVGGLTAHTLVAPVVATSPTPTTPTTVPAFLNVLPSATTGVAQVFGVSSSATGVTWNWSFGDGGTAQTTAFGTTHTFSSAGVFTASVSAPGTSTGTAVVTVTDPTPTAGPATTTLSVTLTCTPGKATAPTAPTTCNTNETFGGAAVPGGAVSSVAWDWGDGTNTDNSTLQPVNTHTYAKVGTYTVIATVNANTTGGAKTGTAVTSVVVP
jgi:PKD domain